MRIRPLYFKNNIMKKVKAFVNILATAMLVVFSSAVVHAQKSASLSDAEIAAAAVAANQGDIDFANIARQKSNDAEILKFAATMAKDHQSVIDQAVALVKKLNVTPKESDLSKKLKADAAQTGKMLRAKSGNAFNEAYISNEVGYHKAVIDAVENVLIPQASNDELKALLQSVVPVLRAHLEHAQMVQKNLAAR